MRACGPRPAHPHCRPINLTIIAVWVSVAVYTGRTNQRMVKYDIVVGEEEQKHLPPPDLSNPLV